MQVYAAWTNPRNCETASIFGEIQVNIIGAQSTRWGSNWKSRYKSYHGMTFFFKNKFISLILVNNIVQVSTIKCYIYHLNIAFCAYHLKSISFYHQIFDPLYPLYPLPPSFSLATTSLCLWICLYCLLLSILYPTYELNHMVFNFCYEQSISFFFAGLQISWQFSL